MIKKISIEVISSLLVLLFVYAAVSKLLDYGNFKFQLGHSPYLANIAGFVSWSLPATEIIAVLLLAVKQSRLIGLYVSFFLMLLFTGYIYIMLNFSYYIPCSCGGILSKMSWSDHFYFNIAFTFLSFAGILMEIYTGAVNNPEETKNIAQ